MTRYTGKLAQIYVSYTSRVSYRVTQRHQTTPSSCIMLSKRVNRCTSDKYDTAFINDANDPTSVPDIALRTFGIVGSTKRESNFQTFSCTIQNLPNMSFTYCYFISYMALCIDNDSSCRRWTHSISISYLFPSNGSSISRKCWL